MVSSSFRKRVFTSRMIRDRISAAEVLACSIAFWRSAASRLFRPQSQGSQVSFMPASAMFWGRRSLVGGMQVAEHQIDVGNELRLLDADVVVGKAHLEVRAGELGALPEGLGLGRIEIDLEEAAARSPGPPGTGVGSRPSKWFSCSFRVTSVIHGGEGVDSAWARRVLTSRLSARSAFRSASCSPTTRSSSRSDRMVSWTASTALCAWRTT